MRKNIYFLIINFLFCQVSPQIGLADKSINIFSFNNATIHVSPNEVLLNSNLIIKDNKILKVGKGAWVDGAIEIDCSGQHIYAGFIDLYNPVSIDTTLRNSPTKHWNDRVHPEYIPNINDEIIASNDKLRKKGFVLSVLAPKDGIFRGQGRVMHLGDFSTNSFFAMNDVQYMAMEHGGWESDDYPGSLLGSIALIRQTFYDSDWYSNAWKIYNKFPKKNKRPEIDDALFSVAKSIDQKTPFCFITYR